MLFLKSGSAFVDMVVPANVALLECAPHLVNFSLPLPLEAVLRAVGKLPRLAQRCDAIAKCLLALLAYRYLGSFFFFFVICCQF